MPIQEVNGGYRWGKSGKVYPTKAQAAKQARAAYASGYKGYAEGGPVTQSTDPFAPNFKLSGKPASETVYIGEPQEERAQDTFAKDFAKYLLMTGVMSNPKTRRNLGMAKMFRDQGPMGLGKVLGQRAGIEGLFKKAGPWATLLQNKGGLLGLGSKGPLGLGIMQGLQDPRTRGLPGIMNRIKFAQAFPQIAGLGWLMNKLSPRIPGQRGALGQGLGPQFANLASKMFGTRTHEQAMEEFGPGIMGGTLGPRIRNLFGGGRDREEGTGIFGGTLGPKLRDLFTRKKDESPIQEIEVTAQRRGEQPEESVGEGYSPSAMSMRMSDDQLYADLAGTGFGSDKLSGLSPGAAQSLNQGLRASNIGKMLAKRAAARALTGKKAKYDRSGLDRKISSGGGGRK